MTHNTRFFIVTLVLFTFLQMWYAIFVVTGNQIAHVLGIFHLFWIGWLMVTEIIRKAIMMYFKYEDN